MNPDYLWVFLMFEWEEVSLQMLVTVFHNRHKSFVYQDYLSDI